MFAARTPLRISDVVIRAAIVGLALATGYIHLKLGGLLFTLNALGGTDNITVGNLEGTGIRHANIDLSDGHGSPDGASDAVTVDGTDRGDRVSVNARDGQVHVSGLSPKTRITGSDTHDHLQVDTGGGNDKVSVDPNVSALIGVGVDLGSGQV